MGRSQWVIFAASVALGAGCYRDATGNLGTRYMHARWEAAKHDGSLACAEILTQQAGLSLSTFCVYSVKKEMCGCTVMRSIAASFSLDAHMADAHEFEVSPYMSLSPGLSWPNPKREARQDAVREGKRLADLP